MNPISCAKVRISPMVQVQLQLHSKLINSNSLCITFNSKEHKWRHRCHFHHFPALELGFFRPRRPMRIPPPSPKQRRRRQVRNPLEFNMDPLLLPLRLGLLRNHMACQQFLTKLQVAHQQLHEELLQAQAQRPRPLHMLMQGLRNRRQLDKRRRCINRSLRAAKRAMVMPMNL